MTKCIVCMTRNRSRSLDLCSVCVDSFGRLVLDQTRERPPPVLLVVRWTAHRVRRMEARRRAKGAVRG